MQHKKGFIEFMCHFMASCISDIINTLESACMTKNSSPKPREAKIHSQGHKALIWNWSACRTKSSNPQGQKNTKPQEEKIQSQGHKTLMLDLECM